MKKIGLTFLSIIFVSTFAIYFFASPSKSHPFYEVEIDFDDGGPSIGYRILKGEGSASLRLKMVYRRALSKFPSYEDCIVKRDIETYEINWKKITSGAQLEVCLINIVEKSGSAEEAMEWLKAAKVSSRNQFVEYKENEYYGRKKVNRNYLIISARQLDEHHPILSFFITFFGGKRFVYLDIASDGTVKYIKQEITTF